MLALRVALDALKAAFSQSRGSLIMTEPEAGAPSRGKPNTVTWPPFEQTKEAFDACVRAVGKVAYAWNYLHEQLGMLFAVVRDEENEAARSVWYSVQSDRTQRKILRDAVNAINSERSKRLPKAPDDLNGCSIKRTNSPSTATMLFMRHVRSTSGRSGLR
jgi:hypothetical protein